MHFVRTEDCGYLLREKGEFVTLLHRKARRRQIFIWFHHNFVHTRSWNRKKKKKTQETSLPTRYNRKITSQTFSADTEKRFLRIAKQLHRVFRRPLLAFTTSYNCDNLN